MMAKRLTPIERAIVGAPVDRRRRYDERMRERGFKRITVNVAPDDVKLVQWLAAQSRVLSREEFKKLIDDLHVSSGSARTESIEGARSPARAVSTETK
jgi:hypothetical protein